MRTKVRRPWIALIANLLAAPLGHFYLGAPLRGLVVVAVSFAIALTALLASMHLEGTGSFTFLMSLFTLACLAVPVDAYRVARRTGSTYALKPYNRWFVYLAVLVVAWWGGEHVRASVRRQAQGYRIPAGAMLPTLQIGDHILVDKSAYTDHGPQRLDVVIFEYPQDATKTFVKRVIALPGETVEIKNKKVLINGAELHESYAYYDEAETSRSVSRRDETGPIRVPDGELLRSGRQPRP